MRNIFLLPLATMMGIMASCTSKSLSADSADTSSTNNPLLTKSTLPYQAPPFDKIKDSDFKPALEEGMKQQQAEVQKIADNPDAPTFENTLVAMEKTGVLLRRANNVFNVLTGANTDTILQKVQEEVAPELAANADAIFLNSKLFKRIETIHNDSTNSKLDAEDKRLVAYYYQQFVKAGARLSDSDKVTP